MSIICGEELKNYLKKTPPIVENILNPDLQVGTNGIDLTVKIVEKFVGFGRVDFTNKERKLAETTQLKFENDILHLEPGAYKIIYNEIINVPLNMVALAKPRSSLLRNGVTVETALWDSGYKGRSESLLVIHNPYGFELKRNARVMQIIFNKITEEMKEGYKGAYQNEHV